MKGKPFSDLPQWILFYFEISREIVLGFSFLKF